MSRSRASSDVPERVESRRPRAPAPARRAACARPYHRPMHLTEAVLAPLRERYGEPRPLRWEGEVSAEEFTLAGGSPGAPARRHLLRLRPERPARADPEAVLPRGRLAAAGRRRAAGRALRDRRAARGDGGARDPDRARALPRQLRGDLPLRRRRDRLAHPRLLGDAPTRRSCEPIDTHEISAARWGTTAELAGPIRARLLETGRALWRYRVELHDAALDQLEQLR